MVRELNFSHEKSRGILGQHTAYYNKERSDKRTREGQSNAVSHVQYAIKIGKLKSLKTNIVPCAYCGYRATLYEHRDYNKPLDVLPCCRKCNAQLGKAIPRECA